MTSIVLNQKNNQNVLSSLFEPEKYKAGNQEIKLKRNHTLDKEVGGKALEHHGLVKAFNRFLDTSEGHFRFFQIFEKLPNFFNAVLLSAGQERSHELNNLAKNSGPIWKAFAPIRAYSMTNGVLEDVQEAVSAMQDKTLTTSQKSYKAQVAFRELTDLSGMYALTVAWFAPISKHTKHYASPLLKFTDAVTVAHDLTSLNINATKIDFANKLDVSDAVPALKETVEQTKTNLFIATAKDVVALVSGFFAMAWMVTGMALAPAVALAFLSLSSTVLSIARKLHEETMFYKPIDFLDYKQVSLVTV